MEAWIKSVIRWGRPALLQPPGTICMILRRDPMNRAAGEISCQAPSR